MMWDETKTKTSWPPEVSMRFAQAQASVGIDLRSAPRSHYNSVSDAFRAVIDAPADLHLSVVKLRGHRQAPKES
jgi:hypothetical protein